MNNGQTLIPIGTLIFGLLLGTLWSPREKEPSPEQIAAATSRHATKSSNPLSRSSRSSSSTSSRSKETSRHNASFSGEFSVENLIRVFSSINNENELNPMEFARYANQISNLNELEAKALLAELQLPFDDDLDEGKEELAEFAQIVSVVVFSRLCELNGPEAMLMLHDGKFGEELINEFSGIGMNAWVAADPEGARNWFNGALSKLVEIEAKSGDLAELEDPAAALIADGEIFDSYVRGMAKIDPEGLKASINSYQSDDVRAEMQEILAEQIVENAHTKDEILNLLHDDTFDQYEHGKVDLIQKLTQQNPREAASYIETQTPSATRDAMLSVVASTLLQEDPAQGAAWYQAQELSAETTEAERTQNITSHWMQMDLEGAATWLLEQPNNTDRDDSESLLANRSAQKGEWESAFRWSADISDSNSRQETLQRVLRRGWDRSRNSFTPSAVQAAREAGFSNEIDRYIQSRTPTQGGSSLSGHPQLPQ